MHDYNFRMYAIRRIRAGFDKNRMIGRYVHYGSVAGWVCAVVFVFGCDDGAVASLIVRSVGRPFVHSFVLLVSYDDNCSFSNIDLVPLFRLCCLVPCLWDFLFPWWCLSGHISDAAVKALEDGEKQLLVLSRQSVLSRLYPSAHSVMETPTAVE